MKHAKARLGKQIAEKHPEPRKGQIGETNCRKASGTCQQFSGRNSTHFSAASPNLLTAHGQRAQSKINCRMCVSPKRSSSCRWSNKSVQNKAVLKANKACVQHRHARHANKSTQNKQSGTERKQSLRSVPPRKRQAKKKYAKQSGTERKQSFCVQYRPARFRFAWVNAEDHTMGSWRLRLQ